MGCLDRSEKRAGQGQGQGGVCSSTDHKEQGVSVVVYLRTTTAVAASAARPRA
jgi:hypothetical protein